MRAALILMLASLLGLGRPAVAQDLRVVLEAAFLLESRLLEAASDRYLERREAEEKAIGDLITLNRRMDEALTDASISVEELRELESQVLTQRELALSLGREVTMLRQDLYRGMDRVAELGLSLEQERDRSLVETDQLSGMWRFESEESGEFGIVRLRLDGAVVAGTYRMSNGSRGSLRGTLAGSRLVLERVDAQLGTDLTLDGTLDPQAGEIVGEWVRKELAGGEPSHGTWSARKLSDDEERELGGSIEQR